MKAFTCLMLATALVFSSACDGKDPSEPDNGGPGTPGDKDKTPTLTYSVKVAGEFPYNWSSSDQVKVCDPTTGGNYGTASLSGGEGTSVGTFTLTKTLADGTSLCLVYPAAKTLGSNASLYQNQTSAGFGDPQIGPYLFAVSNAFGSAASNTVSLDNPLAAIRVRFDTDDYQGYKLSSLTIRCADAALSGSYTIEKQTLSFKVTDAKHSVTLSLSDKPMVNGRDSYATILTFPSDLTGLNVTLDLALESPQGLQSEKSYRVNPGRLEPGKVKEVKLSEMVSDEYVLTDVSYYWWRNGKYVTAPSRTVSGMNRMEKLTEDTARDNWGGFNGVKPTRTTSSNPEGFWRTGYYQDKKVFIDPDGNVAFLTGFNFVCPDVNIDNYGAPVANYYQAKFASLNDWAEWCAPRIADMAFNFYSSSPRRIKYYDNMPSPGISITPSAQERLHRGNGTYKLSQCENLFLLRTFYWDYKAITGKSFDPKVQSEFTLMFDPDYLVKIRELAEYGAALFKDDRSFIGYYIDNELPFVDATTSYPYPISLKGFLELVTDPSDTKYFRCNEPAKKWAQDWMQAQYGTQTYASSMEKAFLAAVSDYYFKTTSEAIRHADPNHLVLGSRIHADAKETKEVMEACARYCDVVSFNFYAYWVISSFTAFQSFPAWVGDKPCLVSEFYTKDSTLKSPDGTVYKNGEGAGWIVDSQRDRGIFYQNNLIRFIEDNQIAGWQYFKWTDDYDTSSAGWVNKGVVVPDYSGVHEACVKLMKEVNINQYQILKYYHP